MTTTDGRLVRGARSRSAIMKIAVNTASVDGLNGLSIGGLAADADISKSGVVALFGTKEKLQLATVEAARQIFAGEVVRPTLAVPGGIERLETLISTWLDYSRNRIFAGGCFFAAATIEVGSQPGPVRDAVAASFEEWYEFLGRTIERARDKGELAPRVDVKQLTFQISAFLDAANARSLLTSSPEPYELAAEASRILLAANAA